MMHRNSPRRNSQTCTSDLLTWPELPPPVSAASVPTATTHRSHQPSDQMSDVLRRDQLTDEEAQTLTNTKPCSEYKMKDVTGSGIFSTSAEDTTPEADSEISKNKASIRVNQQATNYGKSQISFYTEESVSPKKPASIPEVAKQRELSGTFHSEEPDAKTQKQTTSAKTKELSGSDIFGPPPEIVPRSVAAAGFTDSRDRIDMEEYLPRNVHTSVRVSNPAGGQSSIVFGDEPAQNTSKKIHDQKLTDLTGNNIFKDDAPLGTVEKLRSSAKLREMAGSDIFGDGIAENRDKILGGRRHHGGGSDIFADGKAENRDKILGARKPPGGGSSISLT
ncbi:uncharacterized protein LOC130714318 [Lotus japonicus]|uniref:uncharacterized protein LOC130714318 n=1 Tax=Lotus japonicus TaxID=34305 RepID=UPI002590DADC|nr:uncharacterized protein LOC130714318 [Lotus japonicus]XP_057420204.1 uncharacterized protein LOC130714318 [Lotus japonicus]